MLRVEEVIFYRDVPSDFDGPLDAFVSPDAVVDRFRWLQPAMYPYLLDFTVRVRFIHSGPLSGYLVFRITKDGQSVYKSAAQPIYADVPEGPDEPVRMNAHLQQVSFPEPGNYFVEIVFNDRLRHREYLLLE